MVLSGIPPVLCCSLPALLVWFLPYGIFIFILFFYFLFYVVGLARFHFEQWKKKSTTRTEEKKEEPAKSFPTSSFFLPPLWNLLFFSLFFPALPQDSSSFTHDVSFLILFYHQRIPFFLCIGGSSFRYLKKIPLVLLSNFRGIIKLTSIWCGIWSVFAFCCNTLWHHPHCFLIIKNSFPLISKLFFSLPSSLFLPPPT